MPGAIRWLSRNVLDGSTLGHTVSVYGDDGGGNYRTASGLAGGRVNGARNCVHRSLQFSNEGFARIEAITTITETKDATSKTDSLTTAEIALIVVAVLLAVVLFVWCVVYWRNKLKSDYRFFHNMM